MKRMISLLMMIVMVFCCCVSAFAAVSDTEIDALKQVIVADGSGHTVEDVEMISCEKLSNGFLLFTYQFKQNTGTCDVPEFTLGNYLYRYANDVPRSRYNLYDGTQIYLLEKAYEEGLIDDALLDEIAEIVGLDERTQHGFQKLNEDTPPAVDATEANDATKDDATKDSATPNEEKSQSNPNAVKTGSAVPLTVVSLSLLALVSLSAIVLKKREEG